MDKKKKNVEKDKITELKSKCEEYLNGWKRAQADYQNLVKETAQQKMDIIKNANQGLVLELLPILDNFKMAFNQIPENEKDSAWVVGFSHIKKQFEDILTGYGLEAIETVGKKFNHEEHEAIETRNEEGQEDDIILEERKAGYRMNGKVIQVAKVIVNSLNKQKGE